MAARREIASILVAIVCTAAAGPGRAEPPARTVSGELAGLLSRAQEDLRSGRAREAIARLSAFRGEDHALRQLLLGHAHVQQSNLQAAGAAYRAALKMDPAMAEAGIALAQVLGRQESWAASATLLGRFVETDSCEADVLLLYAQVARRLADERLCGLLARKGILRFPADGRFRRLDLAICIGRGDHRAARETLALLMKDAPADAGLWQQLASLADQAGSDADRLAALEACALCQPEQLDRHRRFLAALVAAGDWPTALKHGRALLAGPLGADARASAELMELLIRAADAGRQDQLLGAWLAAVPQKAWTRAVRIVAARRALRLGDTPRAREALAGLVETGEMDPAVFVWAGHLAETAEDSPEAETLYAHARTLKGPAAGLATLYLARLHFRTGRGPAAARLLRGHLDAHPEDAYARALLAVVDAARKTPPAD